MTAPAPTDRDDARLRTYGPMEKVAATYRTVVDPALPEAWGNPLLEALPPIPSDDDVFRLLTTLPAFDPRHINLEPHDRYTRILMIKRFFVPLSEQRAIAHALMQIIRLGYVGRNPVNPCRWTDLDACLERLRQVAIALRDEELTFDGFSIIGTSGVGKTELIKRALSLVPRLIQHHDYRGVPIDEPQLVYVRLDCPEDGSIRTLQEDFFTSVDDICGTEYYRLYARNGQASKSEMITGMGRVAALHNLGLLVIDEIQVLEEMRRSDPTQLLNFLVRLSNVLKVPVVLVGTPKARALLRAKLRMARRTEGMGDFSWYQIAKDGDWDLFVSSLWPYYYLKNPCPQPPRLGEPASRDYAALKDALYEETQGITDFAIKVFQQAQIVAMLSGEEVLTVDAVRSVAKHKLRSARPLLLAVRAGNERTLETLDDMPLVELDEYVAKATAEMYGRQPIRPPTDGEMPQSDALPPTPGVAGPAQQGTAATVNSRATPAMDGSKAPSESLARPRRRRGQPASVAAPRGKLSTIIAEARARNVTPYEALERGGYIASAAEFMAMELPA